MKTFAITTLGCKVNSVESDRYIQVMKQANIQQVDFKESADTYIINTCAVTHSAAAKSRQRIAQAIKANPDAKIVVVGCSLAGDLDNLSKINNIDTLIFQDQKDRFDEIVLKQTLSKDLHVVHNSKTRGFLKIQDGCEQFCSFCIIPIARGSERSVNIDELEETTRQLVQANHKEIVLTGIHIGRYGIKDNTSLLELLKRLVTIEGLKRIRISSIEITELHDELIDFIVKQPLIAKHLHIPLQSGSDEVLKAMSRPYDMEYFFNKVDMIRKKIPSVLISSDVIAGFVNESESQFQETIENIKKLKLGFLHVFPYSKRKFTKAALMSNHLSSSVIKQRSQRLNKLSRNLREQFHRGYLNQEVSVLIEHPVKQGMFGHTEHYLPVVVLDSSIKSNEIVQVKINDVTNNICFGIIE